MAWRRPGRGSRAPDGAQARRGLAGEVGAAAEAVRGAGAGGNRVVSGSFSFGAEAGSVRRSRQFAADLCGALSSAGHDDVLLCVSELVTNVVLHARTDGELRLSVRTDGVRIEVDDGCPDAPSLAGGANGPAVPGPAPGPADTAPTAASVSGPPVGGRGLRIVDQLATAWGHAARPGGKTVWAELSFPPPSVTSGRLQDG